MTAESVAQAAPLKYETAVQVTQDVTATQPQTTDATSTTEAPRQAQPEEATSTVEPERPPEPVKATVAKQKPAKQAISCGDNEYANFIYMKESSCNLNAVNSIGCRGIGQACPGSKLPCGDDYECQNKWFTNYAIQRYGSWEQAYNFWLKNHWW